MGPSPPLQRPVTCCPSVAIKPPGFCLLPQLYLQRPTTTCDDGRRATGKAANAAHVANLRQALLAVLADHVIGCRRRILVLRPDTSPATLQGVLQVLGRRGSVRAYA